MSDIQIILRHDVYLDHNVPTITLTDPIYAGDAGAQRIMFRVFKKHGAQAPVNLSECNVTAHFVRPDEGDVVITGTAGAEWSYVDLPAACYVYPGAFSLLIRITGNELITSVIRITGRVEKATSDTIIDPGTDVGSIDEILAAFDQIEESKDTAVAASETATGAAETATNAAESATADAQTATSAAASAQEDAQAADASAAAAHTDAETASAAALDSEAWAVGKRNGEDVDEDDPAYGNNAKKYAQDAGGSAAAAGVFKQDAEAWAKGTKNGQAVPASDPAYEKNAKYYAEQAFSGTPEGYAELVGDVGDLKSAMSMNTKLTAIPMTTGAYINTGGSTVNINNPTTSANFSYAVVECNEGDTFIVNATGGTYPRPFAFVKSDGTTLYRCAAGTVTNFEIKAPKDSAYLVINNNSGATSYRGSYVADEIEKINAKIGTLSEYVEFPLMASQSRKISISSKSVATGGVAEYVALVRVQAGQTVKFKASASGSAAEYALGVSTDFTFANTTISSVYPDIDLALGNSHGGEYTLTIPDGINALLISRLNAYDSNGTKIQYLRDTAKQRLEYAVGLNADDYEVGTINPTTGENQVTDARCRSKGYVAPGLVRIISENVDYPVYVFAYDSNDNYIGVYANNYTYVPTASPNPFIAYDFSIADTSLKYRIAIVKGATLTPEAVTAIKIYYKLEDKISEIETELENIQAEEETELFYSANDSIATVPTADDLWGLYDALVSAYPNYVSKNTLTQGALTNYEYVFDSHSYNYQSANRPKFAATAKPEILITTGVHGNEPVAVMAAYGFFKALCEDKKAVSKIRQSFVFRIIPLAVPWGFTNRKRWNENGVNINRNFDANWVAPGESSQPYTNNYQGTSAASELETQLVQAWLQAHTDAALYIDYHNSGYTSEVSYLSLSQTYTTNFDGWSNSFRYGLNQVIGHWRKDRQMIADTLIYGYTGHMDINGGSETYGNKINLTSMTLETSENQNGSGINSKYTIGVGLEAFAAMMKGFMDYYFKV